MKTSTERTKDILARADAEKARRKKRITLTSVLAAGLSLVLAFNLVLFIPYNTAMPDLSAADQRTHLPPAPLQEQLRGVVR